MARDLCAYSGADIYMIATRDDGAVAYGMLRGWDEGFEVPSLGIAVHPAARGTGIGRLLMAALHAEAWQRGAPAVRLRVHPDNRAAVALYGSLGYVFDGEERGELVGRLARPGEPGR